MSNGWCFAKINNKLAEIFFEERNGRLAFFGHCYVKRVNYKTKRNQKWIDSDTKKFNFAYKNKEYVDIKTGEKYKLIPVKE